MKTTLIFSITLFLANPCLAADKRQSGMISMLDGMENIYLGMPMAELLKTRPRLGSGTNWWDLFDRGDLLLNDTNNPKKIDISAIEAKWPKYGYDFKEKIKIPLIETIYYSFSRPWLGSIGLRGIIDTRKEIKEYPRNRDKLIEQVIQKWGKPDKVFAGEHISDSFKTGARHDYYSIEMEWSKGDVSMRLDCPVVVAEYSKTISLLQKFWGKIIRYGITVEIFITYNPDEKVFHRKPPFHSHYKQVEAGETERLLNSIKYYEILEKALKPRNTN